MSTADEGAMLNHGRTPLFNGMKSKARKKFDA